MHDGNRGYCDHLDAEVERFLTTARAIAHATPAPAPDDRLRALFVHGAPEAVGAIATATAPRPAKVRRLFSTLAAKGAAALLGGGLVIGGLGVAGALPGGLAPTARPSPPVTSDGSAASTDPVVAAPPPASDDTSAGTAAGADDRGPRPVSPMASAAGGHRDASSDGAPGGAGPETPPASVSEAAQTHTFDEACGNHGAYVSWFAQHATEPSCATDAGDAGDVTLTATPPRPAGPAGPHSASVQPTSLKSPSPHNDQQRKG